PNAAHFAITQMADYFNAVTVVTQNVDNLHRRAGNPLVHELHGNIEKNYCMKCKTRYDFISFENTGSVPKCSCGGLIRPDVVWFGEMLPQFEYEAAENAMSSCDILFSVGTSAVVYPAAGLPMLAYQAGAYLIEINPERTEQSNYFNESFRVGAGEALTVILNEVQSIRQHKK
ncbi:MAG: NAD-dependent protein deacylase, partial [Ignavibacteriales bacterium]|nr:NAD-dependent protein deacylase [Ignavibacteriales bacterium]